MVSDVGRGIVEEFASVMSTLVDLHLNKLESSARYHAERIQGIQIYVFAIAVLSAFAITKGPTAGLRGLYLLLLSLATVVVLLFQMYWWYYAFLDNRLARYYQSEITQFATSDKATVAEAWPLTKGECFYVVLEDGKPPRREVTDTPKKIWLFRKTQQAQNEWWQVPHPWQAGQFMPRKAHFEVEPYTSKSGKQAYAYSCDGYFGDWRVLFAWRQVNIWTLSILAFFGCSAFGMWRILAPTGTR